MPQSSEPTLQGSATPIAADAPKPVAGQPAPPAAEATAETTAFAGRTLKKWLVALSVSTLFASAGFIAAIGREQFLGISSGDWTLQALTALAGRCIVDTVLLLLEFVGDYWYLFLLLLLVLAAAVACRELCKFPLWLSKTVYLLTVFASIVLLAFVLIRYETPTIALRSWVVMPQGETPLDLDFAQMERTTTKCPINPIATRQSAPSPDGSQAALQIPVVGNFNCYFASKTADVGILLLDSKSQDIANKLSEKGLSYTSSNDAKRIVEQRYAATFAVCLIVALALGALSKNPFPDRWKNELSLLLWSAYALLVVTSVFIPYVYGKVIDSTVLPLCDITYKDTTEPEKPRIVSGQAPVLAQKDSSLSLLWIHDGGMTEARVVPRQNILALSFYAPVDALEQMYNCQIREGVRPLCH